MKTLYWARPVDINIGFTILISNGHQLLAFSDRHLYSSFWHGVTLALPPCKRAPMALTFRSCNCLSVKDLKFQNSQQMPVTFSKCAGVGISWLAISAPGESPNTDGIHVSGSTDVKISDSVIRTGDNCISIISGSRFVMATNTFAGGATGSSADLIMSSTVSCFSSNDNCYDESSISYLRWSR